MSMKLGLGPRLSGTLFVSCLTAFSLAGVGCQAPQQGAEEQPGEETGAPAGQSEAPRAESRPEAASGSREPKTSTAASRKAEPEPEPEREPEPEPTPQIEQVEIPSGTILELELLTSVDSSLNRAGDELQAKTLSPVFVEGREVLAAGAYLEGKVTEAKASGRVKGRARLGLTFDRLKTPTGTVKIRTSYVEQEAESGKKKDAAVIGGAAGVGAIVGGIIGGKKGAAIGATVGGAGGTGVVLSTKGEEIRLPVGARLNVRLDEPVVIELH